MALSYTVHGTPAQVSSGNPNVATFPWTAGERALLAATNSAAIVGPCELRLYADEAQWLDIEATTAALDTGTTPMKLPIGETWASLPKGNWFLKWVAA